MREIKKINAIVKNCYLSQGVSICPDILEGLSHPGGGSEMVNDKLRVVAYDKSKNNHYYFELSPGSTTKEAQVKVCEFQSKFGAAWIEIYENENWKNYE